MKEDTLLLHQPGMHAAFVGGSAVQMQDLRPTYVNAQETPLYNSHHRIDGLPKNTETALKKESVAVNSPSIFFTTPELITLIMTEQLRSSNKMVMEMKREILRRREIFRQRRLNNTLQPNGLNERIG